MPLTNRAGVCRAWVIAAEKEDHEIIPGFRVTELIAPVQQQALLKRHKDEVVEDVMDRMWAIWGQAIHWVLEQAAGKDAIAEQRFFVKVGEDQIALKPDRIEPLEKSLYIDVPANWMFPKDAPQFELIDFKTPKVWAILMGHKHEWEIQTNIYAWALRKIGINVTRIRIECLLKDWDFTESLRDSRYPPEKVFVIKDVPMWQDNTVESYVKLRIHEHKTARQLPDDQLPPCDMSERWASPDEYAVRKKGGKNALPGGKGFISVEQANIFARSKEYATEVEFRPGLSRRCFGSGDYKGCPVRQFCKQFKTLPAPKDRSIVSQTEF